MPQPLLLNYGDAARLLSVSVRTVQRMVRDGRLTPFYLTTDTPRLRLSDLTKLTEPDAGAT